jgi:hypothetical protein
MQRSTRRLAALAAGLATLGVAASAQPQDRSKPGGGVSPQHLELFSCHGQGSGAARIDVCVSSHGNVSSFQIGGGPDHINSEGYVICSHASDQGTAGETGFGAATISQPNGPNTFPLTITRSTTDGAFRLAQSYKLDQPNGQFIVTNKLTNTSGATLNNVGFLRSVDVDAEGTYSNDIGDATTDSASVHEPFGAAVVGRGLMLAPQNLSYNLDITPIIQSFADFREGSCPVPLGPPPPTGQGDWVALLRFGNITLAKNQTKTIVTRLARI